MIQPTAARPTHVRHVVLWLTVAAYMITYMDRVEISSAVPVIQKELGLRMVTMGWILSSFRWGYALFQIPGGWLGDRIGPRRALALIVTWWSLFTSAHGACLECRVHGGVPIPVRHGRSRSVPDRYAVAFTLDAAGRARLCAKRHARGFALGRRSRRRSWWQS